MTNVTNDSFIVYKTQDTVETYETEKTYIRLSYIICVWWRFNNHLVHELLFAVESVSINLARTVSKVSLYELTKLSFRL